LPIPYTNAELEEFYARFLRLPQMDLVQFRKSVQQEISQHVFRPIDIKETFPRSDAFGAGPLNVTSLSANIAQPTPLAPVGNIPGRMLIVRGFSFRSTGGDPPDEVIISILNQAVGLDREMARSSTFVSVGPDNQFTQVVFALLPFVIYPGHSLRVTFTRAVAGDLGITGAFYGEECDFPLRSFGT